jgi:hypothetical protein
VAWILAPCGAVRLAGGAEETTGRIGVEHGLAARVSYSWRQRRGEPFRSRFAGLLSQMDAAVLSSEHARR